MWPWLSSVTAISFRYDDVFKVFDVFNLFDDKKTKKKKKKLHHNRPSHPEGSSFEEF